MSGFGRSVAVIFWLLTAITAIVPGSARAASCGVSGSTAVSVGNYNPFAGSGLNQVQVTLNLTRVHSNDGFTREVNFYFVQPSGSPNYAINYNGTNVLYTLPASQFLSLDFYLYGTVYYDFGNQNAPDTVSIPLVVTIPGNLNLVAGDPIVFDIRYICRGQSRLESVYFPATLTDAMTVRINVLSALQASYAGPALDFGEVGAVTDSQAPTHSIAGNVRVASSGPFTVTMNSANAYRMTYPGGNIATTAETLRYSARFLGQTKSSATPNFSTVYCNRAGTGGQILPISVTLLEGGTTKVPSPNYLDTLTVTVAPLAVPYGGATMNCPGL